MENKAAHVVGDLGQSDLGFGAREADRAYKQRRWAFESGERIAQFEKEIRAERQMEGILKAKRRGVKFGKLKALSPDQARKLRQKRKKGVLIRTLMKQMDLSKASVYRYLNPK